jgi:nucleoside-diphosphate kinase
MSNGKLEQTLVLIKPDALKNSLTGYLLSQLSEFHTGLLEYIMGSIHYPDEPFKRRVIAIVYQGQNAVKKIRDIAGPTNPHVARKDRPGCIRALGTIVPLRDADGKEIGERIDNLIHASATPEEAEREIKLWFKPNDIPPLMHIYPTAASDDYCYFKDSEFRNKPELNAICLLAPGDIAWKSDLEVLDQLKRGASPAYTFQAVAAKYLLNSGIS